MILGHIGGISSIIRGLIFSFHMPIFFVANSYFIKQYSIKKTLIRSSKSLLIRKRQTVRSPLKYAAD